MTPRALAVLQIPTESVFSRAGALVAISFQMVPRVAKVGSISARAKMTVKTFVKRNKKNTIGDGGSTAL